MPNYYQHNGTSYVHVSDYAALEARLAEAGAKLLAWESAKPRCACGKVVIPILPHHGTADSADVQEIGVTHE